MTDLPLHDIAQRIHESATEHGFWPAEGRNFAEMLMLATSELAEAMEEHRSSRPKVWFRHAVTCGVWHTNAWAPCDCTPKPEGAAVEIIDAIIRELDTLYDLLQDTPYIIDNLVQAKMEYNAHRPFKHGKAY